MMLSLPQLANLIICKNAVYSFSHTWLSDFRE
jgi:hypothetical protein